MNFMETFSPKENNCHLNVVGLPIFNKFDQLHKHRLINSFCVTLSIVN